MHERYAKDNIVKIWSDENKLSKWQTVEMAVIRARVGLRRLARQSYELINSSLTKAPIDVGKWKALDKLLRHDLVAFLTERQEHLPTDLHTIWHKDMTSYDTEDPALALMILESLAEITPAIQRLKQRLSDMARKYRYTIMMGETHGQYADLQTFGALCLTWLAEIQTGERRLGSAKNFLKQSKLSGAIGKYEALDPVLEKEALGCLGLEPFYGATQIVPRIIFIPTAESLSALVGTCHKIANDLWLGCRSSERLWQEPFGKQQKGSSIMPHKKNPITLEQIEGMHNMARHYAGMIRDTLVTPRERAIGQSCVERVAWPDLFHTALHTLEQIERVLSNLQVYPDQMMRQVVESRGCYAASKAKEVLKEWLAPYGISTDNAYKVVQLAAFNLLDADEKSQKLRENPPTNLEAADHALFDYQPANHCKPDSIQFLIQTAMLRPSPTLDTTEAQVDEWNAALIKIFASPDTVEIWNRCFLPSEHIKGQSKLYQELVGEYF